MSEEENPSPINDEGTTPAPAAPAPATPAPADQPTKPADDATPAAKPDGDKPAEDPKPDDAAPAEADKVAAEPPKDDTPPHEEPVDPKEQARRQFAERQRMKTQAQQELRQQVQPQTPAELEQLGYEPKDAEVEALRQRVEASEFTANVAELTANMNMDATSVEQEFSIFNEKSPSFDKAFADKVSREYIRDARVKFDDSGQYVLSADVPMYDYYKSRYEDRMGGIKAGQVKREQANDKMRSSAETPSSAPPPPTPDKDPIAKGFAEVFGA